MKQNMKELRKLKGVGDVLAKRFIEAGFDTLGKVAGADVEDLKKIPGTNPRVLPQIVSQAGELVEDVAKSREEKIEELKRQAASVKMRINDLACEVRNRFQEDISAKAGVKVEKEFRKFLLSLEKAEAKIPSRVKKAGKGLAKAEKRLAAFTGEGLKDIGRVVKKAKKSLKRVYR